MTRKPPKNRLSSADQAIWDHIKQSVTPLKSKLKPLKSDLQDGTASLPTNDAALERPADDVRPIPVLPSSLTPRSPSPDKAPILKNPAQSIPKVDQKIERKLSRGQRDIEARLDLHGLRQDEAYRALHKFLLSCQARGLRHVIIITGKGKSDRGRPIDPFLEPQGVLRRRLPQWLSDPALKPLIAGVSQAPRHHGGDGAFYVHIKKKPAVR